MVDIPKSILNKLQCSRCEGYLSISPVMVTTGAQICGKCFKILPAEEKRRYVREIGLEAVAEMLIFPCRYHRQGCLFEVLFNNGEDHERECPHRHILQYLNETAEADDNNDSTNPLLNAGSHSTDALFRDSSLSVMCQSKELRLASEYSLKQNNQSKNNVLLKYTIDIGASSGYALCLQSEQYIKPVEIKVEGAITLKNSPESIYCEIKTKDGAKGNFVSRSEHVYESLNSRHGNVRKCNNCNTTIVNEAFYCLRGHHFCRNCRGDACLHCTTHVSNTPLFPCKNHIQGCKEMLLHLNVRKHQADCEFNTFQCPLANCDWLGVLKTTKLHVLEQHADKTVESAEISRKSTTFDETWLMFAYDNMFKCKYFHYDTFVEFLVIYFGSHDKAKYFKYEIEIRFNHKTLKKSAACIGWNGFSLESGVTIQNSEVLDLTRNKHSCNTGFDYNLRISEWKESSL